MRSGNKKIQLAANPKTRRCVVRVKRMKTQAMKTNARRPAAPAKVAEPTTSSKKHPIGPAAKSSNTSLSTSLKAKDRIIKTPIVSKNVKAVEEAKKTVTPVVAEELPPTIAAGRSRRTHKPNPKYANEDMLTPKSLKPLATTSLDDVFNKASNDSENESSRAATTKSHSKIAKQIQMDSDSDFDENIDDSSDTSLYERKTRSRPAKGTISTSTETIARRSTAGATNTQSLSKTAPSVKTVPTQLKQLRRSLNASNLSPLALGKKRKLEESSISATTVVANKRANIQPSAPQIKANEISRRQSPSVASMESKAKPASITDKNSALAANKRSSPLTLTRSASVANLKTLQANKTQQNTVQRGIISRNSLGKASSASTPSLSKSSVTRTTATSLTPPSSSSSSKTRNLISRPALSNKQQNLSLNSKKSNAEESASSEVEETPAIIMDDFETMPTFTIVNINDIINKKGDVLMTEAAAAAAKNKNQAATQKQQTATKQLPQQSKTLPQQSKTQSQSQNKALAKNQNSDSSAAKPKSSQPLSTSTPLVKKPVEKSGNIGGALNKIINRNSGGVTKTTPPTIKGTTSTTKPSTRSSNTNVSDKKPAPRILNSVVSPRTKPIKPVIANLDISDDDPSCSLSLCTDDDEEEADELGFQKDSADIISDSEYSGNESIESSEAESPKKRVQPKRNTTTLTTTKTKAAATPTPTGKSKITTTPPNAAKENSAAVNNVLPKKPLPQTLKRQIPAQQARKLSPEKVVVQREGNKIIKKITCFETWYVINIPADAPEEYERNALDLPLIDLANAAKEVNLPSGLWTTKVTLNEIRKPLSKTDLTIYTGDLTEQNIKESERANYQPTCVMFRRTVPDRVKLQLPYDRAVIFKNKTFFTNIEGKNVKLVGAPTAIKDVTEVETLLNIVDGLTLQSPFVEPASTIL